MDSAINFYELKTQLADLGFRETEMVDDLRFNISSSDGHFLLATQIEGEQQETQFFFQMVKDEQGRYSMAHYEGVLDSMGKTGHQYQLFSPEVSAADAMLVLGIRTDFPGHIQVNLAMGPAEVAQFKTIHQSIITENQNIMNTENLAFVKDNFKYLGMPEHLGADFEKQIKNQPDTVTLNARIEHYNSNLDIAVHLKKGNEDMYFLNKYDATLTNGKPEQNKTQTFYIEKGQGITAKEAFNMLEGRAVQKTLKTKENEPYKAWLQLDLAGEKDKNNNYPVQKYGENYGYDLEKSLSRFNIKDLSDPEAKEKLMKSLEKGNLQQVQSKKDGVTGKHYIAANPQYKTINVYNDNQKMVRREGLLNTNSSETKKGQKNGKIEKQATGKNRSRKQSA